MKTHRGLRGRVEKGKAGGGLCYGYRVVKKLDANGEPIRGDREKTVAAALDAVPDLRPESRTFWSWLENHEAPKKAFRPQGRAKTGLSLTSEMDDGATVLGTLELRGRQLLVGVNLRERAARAQAMLAEVLGSLVGEPLTQMETVMLEQVLPPSQALRPNDDPSP